MAGRLIETRPGEGKVLLPAFAFAFLCIGAQTLAFIASDSLFVTAFSLGDLSRFYLVSSVARTVVSVAYGAFAGRGAKADLRLLVGTGMALGGAFALTRVPSSIALYAACVVLVTLPSLLPLVAMSAALDAFHARQAKRLFPLIAAAATMGAIAFGGAAKALAVGLGTPSLLILGGLLCFAAAPMPGLIAKASLAESDEPKAAPGARPPPPWAIASEVAKDIKTIPAVRVFAINAVLAAAMTALVDFAFKAALKARFERDQMASFLGTFNVVSEAAVLVTQLFLTSRAVGLLGIRASLQSRSVILLPLGPLLALTPGVAVATGGKLVEQLLRLSIGGTVADLLLTPAAPAVRSRAKVLAKAAALPLGSLVAGLALSAFGVDGPGPVALGVMVGVLAVVGLVTSADGGKAYVALLLDAVSRRGARPALSAAESAVLRTEVTKLLAESVAAGDEQRARAALAVAGDHLLALEDLAPALRATGEVGKLAARTAVASTKQGEGARLLELCRAGDDETERLVLGRARALGVVADEARIARALERGEAEGAPAAELWAEALEHRAEKDRAGSLAALREGAEGADSPRRAAALRALGELGDREAQRAIQRALDSADASVFAEAARAAVLVELPGAVILLVGALRMGPRAKAAGEALLLAGKAAYEPLLAALPAEPVILDDQAGPPSARSIAGTARAARVLARLGPEACGLLLERFEGLGHRARNAAARALGAVSRETGKRLDPALVTRAMDLILDHAEELRRIRATPGGLLAQEIHHRIGETEGRLLDLAAALGDRAVVAKARAALGGDARTRGNALELLENVLPRAVAARTVALLEHGDEPASATRAAARGQAALDGWLERCRRLDAGELGEDDPQRDALAKVQALHASTLFTGLAGEELLSVAALAERVELARGATVVREGDPGDALYVLVRGRLSVLRSGKRLRELHAGTAFGEIALLDGAPRSATIEAVTDVELLRLPREEFEALMDESPEVSRGIIGTLIGHLRRPAVTEASGGS